MHKISILEIQIDFAIDRFSGIVTAFHGLFIFNHIMWLNCLYLNVVNIITVYSRPV